MAVADAIELCTGGETRHPPSANKLGKKMRGASSFAGLGLGLLAGALVGLSTVPVVAGVVSAITALLAGFFAFGQNIAGGTLWRVAGFGFGGVLGLAGGLLVRSQDLSALSPAREVARWTEAGYAPELARDLVLYARYGIPLAGRTAPEVPVQTTTRSGLFAGTAELCGRVQLLPEASPEIARIILAAEAPGPRFQLAANLLRAQRLSGAEARSLLCDS